MKKTQIIFVIGDWSGDGHGQNEEFWVESSKPLKDVREAYFAARDKLPKELCPEEICNDSDKGIPEDTLKKIRELGFPDLDGEGPCDTESMLEYVFWFIRQADPEISFSVREKPDTFAFYGYDEKQRHISFIGYGLFNF